MKITFNLEQHGSRAFFCSTLMMPWKQTIQMKDDRTVQSVLTPGPLCPASYYRRANSIFFFFFQGPLFGVRKHHLREKTPEGGAESGFRNCTTFPARGRVFEKIKVFTNHGQQDELC